MGSDVHSMITTEVAKRYGINTQADRGRQYSIFQHRAAPVQLVMINIGMIVGCHETAAENGEQGNVVTTVPRQAYATTAC